MRKACARAGAATALVVLVGPGLHGGSFWYAGEPMAVTFGVEADPAGSTRLDDEHVDVSFGSPASSDATALDRVDPDDALSVAPVSPTQYHPYVNATTRRVYDDAFAPFGFDFLALEDGETYWELPQSAPTGGGKLYLGLNTYMPAADADNLAAWNPGDTTSGVTTVDKWLAIDLLDAVMPAGGAFALYQVQQIPSFSFVDFIASADGIDRTDRVHLPPNAHNHYFWGFTEPGLYTLTFRVAGFVEGGFAAWSALEGLPGAPADFPLDNDGNGLSDGLTYACGGVPPSARLANDRLVLEVSLPVAVEGSGREDVHYAIIARDAIDGAESVIAEKDGSAPWTGPATVTRTAITRDHWHFAIEDVVTTSTAPRRLAHLRVTLLE